MRVLVGLVCASVLGLASMANAEPLNAKQVSAEAKWLVHIDADAMRSSVVVDKGYAKCAEKCKALGEKVTDLREACKIFDPTTDLQGLTFYGKEYKPGAGVAIVCGKLTETILNGLSEGVQKMPNYSVSTYNMYQLHTWTHAQGTKHERPIIGVYVQPNYLVFGASEAEVKAALDVLDGSKANLAGTASPLAAAALPGALLLARVSGLADMKLPIESPIIKQTDAMALTLGENNYEAYLTADLAVKDVKTADEVKAMVDGALTNALMGTDDAEMSDLINAARVSSTEKAVSVDVRGPADIGWTYLEKLAAKVAEEGRKQMEKARQGQGK